MLFGIPTLVFLVLSILTVSCSVLKVDYTMPDWGIVARALAGFGFAIVFFLYEQIGKPCDAKERKALEQTIAGLHIEIDQNKQRFETVLKTANSNFQTAMQSKQAEFEYRLNEVIEQGKNQIEHLQNLLESKSMQIQKLSERASSLERDELASYPKVQSLWIEKAKRTVSIDEIAEVTGLSKQRIRAAITGGKIARDNRKKEVFRVSSVIEWLKTIPVNNVPNGYSNGHLETEEDVCELPVLTVID